MAKLTKNDTSFILWSLWYLYSLSDTMDKQHKSFIKKNHARVLPKIAELHEEISERKKKK